MMNIHNKLLYILNINEVFKIFNIGNKKRILSLLLIMMVAILTIGMIGSFSADPTAFGTVKPIKKADIKVTNVIKENNYHYITVKNVGGKTAGKNTLRFTLAKN